MAIYPTLGARVWAAKAGCVWSLDQRPVKIAAAAVSAGPLKCCGEKLPLPSHGGVSGLLPERGVSKMK